MGGIGEGEVEGGEERGGRGRDWVAHLALPPDPVLPPNAEFLDPPMPIMHATSIFYHFILNILSLSSLS